MKHIFFTVLTIVLFLSLNTKAQTIPADSIYARGKLISANFTGKVWVRPLVAQDTVFDLVAGSVTFAPGARSYWHTHNAGQILLITSGTGYTQEKGKSIRIIHKGDIVICPPNVEHWHGAAPGSYMTQISLNTNAHEGVVNWLRPVTDAEYNGPTANK